MRNVFAVLFAAIMPVLVALPAGAQLVGTPGNAPLTPDGPRRGLGPPSITDNVPDLRLRSDGGGIPGAGPLFVPGGTDRPAQFRSQWQGDAAPSRYRASALGQRCQTARRICVLGRAAPVEAGCSCRTGSGRVRGRVVP
ncbi:hypothetical protein C8D03_2981 [Bosea sp. 124]|nr:hypothetical protein C8D03_2981 [Bosea sp. 124]